MKIHHGMMSRDVDPGPLFRAPELPVRARPSDPDSSAQADARLRDSGRLGLACLQTFDALTEYLEHNDEPPTTQELAYGDPALVHLFGRRLSDLGKLGYVEKGPRRECRVKGSKATTWRLPARQRRG